MTGDGTRALVEAHVRRGNDLLARIDEHLARGITDTSPAHLAGGAELTARLEAHVARHAEFVDGPDDGWRFAMRLDSLRHERALGEISQTLVKRTRDFVRYYVGEGREHRDALWRISRELERDDALAHAAS